MVNLSRLWPWAELKSRKRREEKAIVKNFIGGFMI
jgi:hypothetical protein